MTYFKKIIFVIFFCCSFNLIGQQNIFKQYTKKDGLPSNTINTIAQDAIGYLWIATNKGVTKFDGVRFQQINNDETNTILIHNDKKYFGLNNGLYIKTENKDTLLTSKKVSKLFLQKNTLYVGTTEGVFYLNKNYLQPITINTQLDFTTINDIIYFNNNFYISSNKGFWKINDLKKPTEIKKLLTNHIIDSKIYNKKIIVASKSNQLIIIENDTVSKKINTIPDISSIDKIDNEFWITSISNGIEVFNLPNFTFKQKINKYNTIATNAIKSIFYSEKIKIINTLNKGFYLTDYQINNTSKKPQIHIEKIYINNKLKSVKKESNKPVILAPNENNILFNFKTVDILSPQNISYRYQFNNGFSEWNTNNQVQFAALKPGKYTLKIQSKINDNESEIEQLSFIIEMPFYKSTYFILGLITTTLLLSFLILHHHLKNVKRNNDKRIKQLKLDNYMLSLEQKALQLQMNPHFIFNVLNGIKALGNKGAKEELNATVSKFSVLLRSILNNSRKQEITLAEELNTIENYIELEQSMSSKQFDYKIELNINQLESNEIQVPSMLLQPFIENSIQHGFVIGKKGVISINITIENKFLIYTIIDNGIGIYNSQQKKSTTDNNISIALSVTKERIQYLSGSNSLKIDEIKEGLKTTGTKVYFKIPLKTDY